MSKAQSLPLPAGQTAMIRRVLTQEDFVRFAALSGDDNPIHVDPDFAARTQFGRPVAHGMFLFGLIASAVGGRLPGPGTVMLAQDLMFPTPTYAGEEVEVHVEVTRIRPGEGIADLTTTVIRPDGDIGCQGQAVVRLPDAKLPFGPMESFQPTSRPSEGADLKGLRLGQRATLTRAFTEDEVQAYIDLIGDANPLYTDPATARRLGMDRPPLPGGLLGSLFSCLLGTALPGPGTNYLKQRLLFLSPAYPGEAITAAVEIVRLRPAKELVNLRTTCTNPVGETLCDGEALVLVRDVGAR